MKKQSCRMTQQEREAHKEAIKLRKMTDQQLVSYVNDLKERAESSKPKTAEGRNTEGKAVVESFLQALKARAGSGNGIGNGTIFKLKRILDELPDNFAEKEA